MLLPVIKITQLKLVEQVFLERISRHNGSFPSLFIGTAGSLCGFIIGNLIVLYVFINIKIVFPFRNIFFGIGFALGFFFRLLFIFLLAFFKGRIILQFLLNALL